MTRFDPTTIPHRRRNQLTGKWVVVSPQRTKRPWQGQTDDGPSEPPSSYDPSCYLCPGNERAGGVINPPYDSTFVFSNDFAALLPDVDSPAPSDDVFFEAAGAVGECRVICFSPNHGRTLATMELTEIDVVIDLWKSQLAELGERYDYVQIFETRGAISGASNPHPHGQIWASDFLPDEIVAELHHQREYRRARGAHLLVDYAARESAAGVRTVVENEHWIIVVPYWAYWPFETLVLPKRHVPSLLDLSAAESSALGVALRAMLRAFDRLFGVPFPYCSGWHTAPRGLDEEWQLHAHYYPPLLRSADVAKIPASYELLANPQRDLTAESAAEHLRSVV